ncbi:TerB family tellurite resistance protein [Microcoleus sp. N9_B2]|uniref:TerB family tellurite resistance protein n=1 Tax=unclassified Microcoleus TaxID=2642155 RepID=UPI002FD56B20
MSFWDQFKQNVSKINDSLQTNISKFKNNEFADASMAICALIAAADGTINSAERQKTAALIVSNETLKIFPALELKQKFEFYCEKLSQDFDFGKVEAIQAIAKLNKKLDQGRAVIQIGIIIGGADGNFDSDEKKIVKEACHAVGINPGEFDL